MNETVRDILMRVWNETVGLSVGVKSQPGLKYLGEQTMTGDGATHDATLPEGTNMIEISAEAGDVRYTLNSTATLNSGGYVPVSQSRFVLHVTNLTSLAIFAAAPAKAHLIYYQEP
jgi:hypothetical protein